MLLRNLVILFILSSFFIGCTKEDIRMPGIKNLYLKDYATKLIPRQSDPFADSFYFKGTINGKELKWLVTDYRNGDNLEYKYKAASGVGTLSGSCNSCISHYLIEDGIIFKNNADSDSKNYIAVGYNIASRTGNRTEIASWFLPGNKPFGKPRLNLADKVKDGVYIYYLDETGKEWISHNAAANQDQSFFRSVSLKDEYRIGVNGTKKWKAQFSCKLFDRSGNYILLKDCELYVPVLPAK